MNTYDHKPSLHEFIGTEYNSRSVIFAASACTSIGALLIFATELIVGSRFLAGLIPEIPEWITVTFMCTIGFLYTAVGGFRAVITTDRLQMKFIWGLIVVLVIAYSIHIFDTGFSVSLAKVPNGIFDFSPRRGLFFFLIGIAIMNIPTHISNMSIWQRISGAQQPEFVVKGFRQSIWGTALSWGSLATLACCAYMIVTPENDKTLFTDMLAVISENPLGKIFLFFIVLGLYGAMLSTASTLLIVVTHTISEDIIARMKSATLTERINSKNEFIQTRIILAIAALIAIFLVEGLKYIGFSIADLVFAIYGGSLALFPLILFALLGKREKLQKLSSYAVCAVSLGFLAGWGTAVYGKIIGNGNLIFLSSGFSISVAFIVILIGFVINKQKS